MIWECMKVPARDFMSFLYERYTKVSWSVVKPSGALFLVPSPKDSHFTGREDIMNLIKAKFDSERRVALTGIGGVGCVL